MKLKNLKADFNIGAQCPPDDEPTVAALIEHLNDVAIKGMPYALPTVVDEMVSAKVADFTKTLAVSGFVVEALVNRHGWREVAGWGLLVYKPTDVSLRSVVEGVMTRETSYNVPELMNFIGELTGQEVQQGPINKVLQRLTKTGVLHRVDRGVYKRMKRGIQ